MQEEYPGPFVPVVPHIRLGKVLNQPFVLVLHLFVAELQEIVEFGGQRHKVDGTNVERVVMIIDAVLLFVVH